MLPEKEIIVTFARSGGPGGQNVNKLNTKAIARWHIGSSQNYSFEQKQLIRHKLKNRLTFGDEIIVSAETERSQLQNKIKAINLLKTLVANALKVSKKRLATKPTRSSKIKRLETKTHRSNIKKSRSVVGDW